MANLNLSSLMEAFALAAGIPPSVWRTVPDHTTAMAQPNARVKTVMLKVRIQILGVRQRMTPTQEGKP